jgi:hypothetical protein
MKKLGIFALAAVAALAACKKSDAGNADSTAVVTDTGAAPVAAPVTPPVTDTTMAPTDTTVTTDTGAAATTTTTTTTTDTTKH